MSQFRSEKIHPNTPYNFTLDQFVSMCLKRPTSMELETFADWIRGINQQIDLVEKLIDGRLEVTFDGSDIHYVETGIEWPPKLDFSRLLANHKWSDNEDG